MEVKDITGKRKYEPKTKMHSVVRPNLQSRNRMADLMKLEEDYNREKRNKNKSNDNFEYTENTSKLYKVSLPYERLLLRGI